MTGINFLSGATAHAPMAAKILPRLDAALGHLDEALRDAGEHGVHPAPYAKNATVPLTTTSTILGRTGHASAALADTQAPLFHGLGTRIMGEEFGGGTLDDVVGRLRDDLHGAVRLLRNEHYADGSSGLVTEAQAGIDALAQVRDDVRAVRSYVGAIPAQAARDIRLAAAQG